MVEGKYKREKKTAPLCKSSGECQSSGLRIYPFSESAPLDGNRVAQAGNLVRKVGKVGNRAAQADGPGHRAEMVGNRAAQDGNLVRKVGKVGDRVAQAGGSGHRAEMVGNRVAQAGGSGHRAEMVGNRVAVAALR